MPLEEIRHHIVDVGASHSLLVERKDLRRTVHNGEAISCASDALGPPTSSSSQFQDRSRCSKGDESVVEYSHLAFPFEQFLLAPVEPPLSLPPFVVLRRPGLVVRPLLCDYALVLHADSFAL